LFSQGNDPENTKVIVFWSGKWNTAQQNYLVHEQELLALVETLKRFRNILHGAQFTLRMDHKALEHFMSQEHFLSGQPLHPTIVLLLLTSFGSQWGSW